MVGIVKSLDSALKANNLEKVAATMDQFEKQFENLDVQSEFVEQAMGNQAALSTPEDEVNLLMQVGCIKSWSKSAWSFPVAILSLIMGAETGAQSLMHLDATNGAFLLLRGQKIWHSFPHSHPLNTHLPLSPSSPMQQVADEHGLDTKLGLPAAGAAQAAPTPAQKEGNDLAQRLAELRGK